MNALGFAERSAPPDFAAWNGGLRNSFARRKEPVMFCNSCNNSSLWIILLIIIIFGYGGFGCGCGCENNCGGNNCGCC